MKNFEIYDSEQKREIGTLLCFEKEHSFIIELCDDLDEWSAPLILSNIVKKGIYTATREQSLRWVQERIIPSNRQNIASVLANAKLSEYDELSIIELSKGKCSQDSMYIRKQDTLPMYVKERMRHNLMECVPCDDNYLLLFFCDGKTRKVSLSECVAFQGIDKVMTNEQLYLSVNVAAGGYCITFNNSIDIHAANLYKMGVEIPLLLNDFLSFVKLNVLDTSDVCTILKCSRQNLQYLVEKNAINPIKKDVKGNLYLKGEVVAM